MSYTTGELARLCNVTVRTVQYYDTQDVLHPSDLTEGGRRLYSDDDLKVMRLICLLRSLGLSLASIKGVLAEEHPEHVLLALLDEQASHLTNEIEERKVQQRAIEVIKRDIADQGTISIQSIGDIEHTMEGRNGLKRFYALVLVIGILCDVLWIGALVYAIITGTWWVFFVALAMVVLIVVPLVRANYHKVAYICPECHTTFQPGMKEFMFSAHTPRTRKLTCPNCGHKGYCVETYAKQAE